MRVKTASTYLPTPFDSSDVDQKEFNSYHLNRCWSMNSCTNWDIHKWNILVDIYDITGIIQVNILTDVSTVVSEKIQSHVKMSSWWKWYMIYPSKWNLINHIENWDSYIYLLLHEQQLHHSIFNFQIYMDPPVPPWPRPYMTLKHVVKVPRLYWPCTHDHLYQLPRNHCMAAIAGQDFPNRATLTDLS